MIRDSHRQAWSSIVSTGPEMSEHRGERVDSPVFLVASAFDPDNIYHIDSNALSRRGDAHERPFMGSVQSFACHDLVGHGDLIVNFDRQVGECAPQNVR